jgi:hypothetical protein
MGDKISSEKTFSTKAGELKISCLSKLASPSLDLSIALAITVFKEFIQIHCYANKAPKVFQTLQVLPQERYYKTLYFPLSLTSENKIRNKKI